MVRGTIKTKRNILFILTVIIFALNWAALHDIVKGNEPDFTAEYTIVVLSSILFVGVIYLFFRKS